MSQSKNKLSTNNSFAATLRANVENHKTKRLAESEKTSKKNKQAKIVRESEVNSQEAKLRSDILRFNEEGFVVIKIDDLEKNVEELSISEGSNLLKSWKKDCLRVFFAINTMIVFQKLTEEINKEAIRIITTEEVVKTSVKYYSKVTVIELIKFIGIHILLENEHSLHSPAIEKNYKTIKNEHKFTMGYNRYLAIKASIKPSSEVFDELLAEWVSQSKVHWTPGTEISIDETIFAYQVRKETKAEFEKMKDPIPMHYIPRKPHKNGLFAWTAATKSDHTNKPYVLDILPHYK